MAQPARTPSLALVGGASRSVRSALRKRSPPVTSPRIAPCLGLLLAFLVQACASESTWERSQLSTGGTDEQGVPAPECHPLFQDCSPDMECYATDGAVAFECAVGSGTQGGFGAACFNGLECEAGLLCSGLEVVAGCSAGYGCCTFFCDLGETECGGGMSCEPYFTEGGPPGFEDLGVCQPSGA
jgi:hypothetical protein